MFRAITRASALLVACITPSLAPLAAQAAEEQDFIDFAASHCRALIAEGRADMAFAMGKASSKFTQEELIAFNRDFAAKLVKDYSIDPAKGCVMESMSRKPVKQASSKPADRSRFAQPKAEREIAVVSGFMGSQGSVAPVSVSYRMERIGVSPWVITNITLNGQPMADRYREEYEALAAKGGSKAVMGNL